MPTVVSIILVTVFILYSTNIFASGAVNRQKQMKQMQQQAAEQAYMQQVQAAQQAAQAQAVAQAQAQMVAQVRQRQTQEAAQQMLGQVQQQQAAAYIQALQQQQGRVMIRNQRQYVDEQQAAAIAVAAHQYQQAIVEQAVKQKIILDAVQIAQVQEIAQAKAQAEAEAEAMQAMQIKHEAQTLQAGREIAQNRPFEPVPSDVVRDIVDITDVWRKLDVDSRSWTLLIDNQAKVETVAEYIDRFGKQGIRIQQTPIDYVHTIDDMAMQNPSLLTRPFKEVLQIAAVMQYDFDNGMDRDALAQKMLGQELYLSNKKRLGR